MQYQGPLHMMTHMPQVEMTAGPAVLFAALLRLRPGTAAARAGGGLHPAGWDVNLEWSSANHPAKLQHKRCAVCCETISITSFCETVQSYMRGRDIGRHPKCIQGVTLGRTCSAAAAAARCASHAAECAAAAASASRCAACSAASASAAAFRSRCSSATADRRICFRHIVHPLQPWMCRPLGRLLGKPVTSCMHQYALSCMPA